MLNACVMFYGCQPITKKLLAEIYIAQGNDCLKQRYFNSHSGLGIAKFTGDTNLIQDTNFIDAIAKFTAALEIDPDNAEAYYNRGFCYSILNQSDSACPDFQKACELGDCAGLKRAIKVHFCKDRRLHIPDDREHQFRLIANTIPIDHEQCSGASRTKNTNNLKATLVTCKPSAKLISHERTRRSYADKEVDHAQNQRNFTVKVRMQTHLWKNSYKLRYRPNNGIRLFEPF